MTAGGELEHLRAEALHAQNRSRLYKARSYGQWPTSPARLRELERIADGARARLRAAEAAQAAAAEIRGAGVPAPLRITPSSSSIS